MSDVNIDHSQPLALILREGTARAHENAEHSPGASWLAKGQLEKPEYVRFLMMLWHVYHHLELGLDRHSSHPTLAPTYNPTLLARAPSLASDIASLLQVPESAWQSHPMHLDLLATLPAPLAQYVKHLSDLADAADPSPLLAHSYVRYMGDLSGGQIIRARVVKAYGLEAEGGDGVRFYEFRELGGSKPAGAGHMKKIKDWFRSGINEGAGDNKRVKAAVLEEANRAFDLTNGLFTLLTPPSTLTSPALAAPPHKAQDTQTLLRLTTVLSVMIAACLTHFLVGGSGAYITLLGIEERIKDFFSA